LPDLKQETEDMRELALLAVAITIAAIPGVRAGNLDAPVEHKITNRTEIARGASAAAHCFGKAVTEADGSPTAYLSCTADADDAETRANTVTKAFELGLEIGTVIDKNIFAKNDPSYAERFSYKVGLTDDRKLIQRMESELGISNDEACAASGKTLEACRAATLGQAR
jgi:hypothetical protein